MATTDVNKLEFLPSTAEQSIVPSFEFRALGAAFALGGQDSDSGIAAAKLSGRCGLTIRQGFDPIDESSTGRVVEGHGDAGITLRKGSFAFTLSAGNLSYRAGLDDPLAAAQASVGEGSVPSLKVTAAKEYRPDCFAAVSYDLKQKKPELALAWSGQTFTEQASVMVHADPVMRTYKLAASVAFPGPEWRNWVYDEEKAIIEEPVDDGARHRLWVAHTVKDRQWGYRTRVGAAVDLGRLVNFVADYVDYNLEPYIPRVFFKLPLSKTLYNFLVPAEDEEQVRHYIHGWDLEASHEFGSKGPVLGVAKHMRFASVRASYDTGAQEAGLTYKRSGLSLTAKIAREGSSWSQWRAPSLHLHVEPLGLL